MKASHDEAKAQTQQSTPTIKPNQIKNYVTLDRVAQNFHPGSQTTKMGNQEGQQMFQQSSPGHFSEGVQPNYQTIQNLPNMGN